MSDCCDGALDAQAVGVPVLQPENVANLEIWVQGTDPDNVIVVGPPDTFSSLNNSANGLGGAFTATAPTEPLVGSLNTLQAIEGDTTRFADFNVARANYAFMHNGAECTIMIAAATNNTLAVGKELLGSFDASFGEIGVSLTRLGSTDRITWRVGNGVALCFNADVTNVWFPGTRILTLRYSFAAGFEARIDSGAVVSGVYANAPSAADSSRDLRLLDYSGSGTPWEGEVGELLVYSRILTDAQTLALESYLAGRWKP